jgi:hypothetical protein
VILDFEVSLIASAIALGATALVYRFVSNLFRRRPPEESDEGGPYAGVTAPLRPGSPKRTARAAVEEPDEPDVED